MASKKAPIFFCHGMWSTGASFDRLKGYFEQRGHACLAPTLPLHDIAPDADAPGGLGDLPLTVYVDAMETHLKSFDTQAVIVGHSMGGLIAQLLAARGHGSKLYCIAPAPMAGGPSLLPEPSRAFLDITMQWGFWQKPHKMKWDAARWSIFNGVPEEEAKHWHEAYVWESGRALSQIAFWRLDPTKASRVNTKAVDIPARFLVGQYDRITPPDFARYANRKYSNSDLHIIPQAGHWLIGEPWWQDTAADLAAFLDAA